MATHSNLPIESIREQLTHTAPAHNRVVLQAPTGSGKSTQLPQMLIDEGIVSEGKIWVLQPRRIAARMLAKRISEERNSTLGQEVGYQIRFDKVSGPATRILMVTEGILLRKMLQDPTLQGIGALVFDEFHERNLYSDLSLAKAFEIQRTTRPDLLIIVMSATLDGEQLESYLHPCSRLNCNGRTYPVEISYRSIGQQPVWEGAAAAFKASIRAGNTGNHLVFMPGAFEIHRTLSAISQLPESKGFQLHALHGEMPPQDQDSAVGASAQPKIIVSTNVAETSLTIPGIKVVIDSGLARIPSYDPRRGVNTILVKSISQTNSDQRAGRAGRESPGKCIRLWSENQQHHRAPFETPEVRRVDLTETLLMLKASKGINPDTFNWFERPDEEQLDHATILLSDLGAIDPQTRYITDLGLTLSKFPIHPRYSRLFVEASQRGCLDGAIDVAALSQDRSILLPLKDRNAEENRAEKLSYGSNLNSDLLLELNALNAARNKRFDMQFCKTMGIHAGLARTANRTSQQFASIAERQGLGFECEQTNHPEELKKCLFIAFSDFVAKRLDEGTLRCAIAHQRSGLRRRESTIKTQWFVSTELEERNVKGSVNIVLGRNSSIEPEWIEDLFEGQIISTNNIEWDSRAKRVIKRNARSFRGISLVEKISNEVSDDEAASVISTLVFKGDLKIKAWNYKVEALIERINFVSQHFPEYEIQPITEEDQSILLEQICYGATTEKELSKVEALPTVYEWLTAEQTPMLETCAPEIIPIPGKGKMKIRYDSGTAIVSARIQQLYDQDPITISGKVPVKYEILAPNQRPVQITDDLHSFWENSYPGIKKELKGRYPKHEWR